MSEVKMLTPEKIITTIPLFVTVGVGVPADLTIIDLIRYVSLTKGLLAPKGFFSVLSVLAFNPTNLYSFITAINLKRDF